MRLGLAFKTDPLRFMELPGETIIALIEEIAEASAEAEERDEDR